MILWALNNMGMAGEVKDGRSFLLNEYFSLLFLPYENLLIGFWWPM